MYELRQVKTQNVVYNGETICYLISVNDVCKEIVVSDAKFQGSRSGTYLLHGGWCVTQEGTARPLYKLKDKTEYFFYNQMYKYWMVGPVPCKNWGGIHGKSDASSPDQETERWKEHDGSRWHETDIKIYCQQG